MEIFVTVALVAALRLALPLVRFVRSKQALVDRFTRAAAASDEQSVPTIELEDERSGAAELTVEWGMFTEAFVQDLLRCPLFRAASAEGAAAEQGDGAEHDEQPEGQ